MKFHFFSYATIIVSVSLSDKLKFLPHLKVEQIYYLNCLFSTLFKYEYIS